MSPPDGSSSLTIGSHQVIIEGCVMHIRFAGNFLRDEIVEILRLAEQINKRHGVIFTLNDMSKLRRIEPEARRYAAEWMRNHHFNGGVLYGGSLLARTAMTLLIRAINIIRKEPVVTLFCETEQEGRDWLAVQIQKVQRAGSSYMPPPPQ
jgi:hypothetical protein